MTIDEFVGKLERIRHRKTGKPVEWELSLNSQLIRFKPGQLRGHCPITAILKTETGQSIEYGNFRQAARLLQLSKADTDKIYLAADNSLYADQKLRARLLKACGLA